MRSQEYDRLIGAMQSLADLPDSEIERIVSLFQPSLLKSGEFLVRVGEFPEKLAFVLSGLLRIYYVDEAGDEYTRGFCTGNRFLTAYSALLQRQPSRLFIQAVENSTILVANSLACLSLLDAHPCWQIVFRKFAEDMFILSERREAQWVLDDAQTRYLNFLKEYPGLESRLKQRYIASYLGIKPATLSRIRSRLRQSVDLGQ
jgi:CRP-like cAMP-binding protein